MKMKIYCILGTLTIALCGCKNKSQENEVISQRFIHKYGYDVSKTEWNEKRYPGQVVTAMRDGVLITSSYENGLLHGPTTRTYPHSQIVEALSLYNQGNVVKEILYDIKGMPIRERVQLSPVRYALTLWYADGTPKSVEEYAGGELLEGQYFTTTNEVEARVEKGNGKKIGRDEKGVLLLSEDIKQGYTTKRETFFPNGAPESITHFSSGKLHGERRTFLATGEPLLIEEWVDGKRHGKTTIFNSGTKISEIFYLDGMKNGLETHYLDGEVISQQIHWENDQRHGPSTYFVGNNTKIEYYYDGAVVDKKIYDSQVKLDEMISHISPELRDIK
ncbi:MAG: toxin-antitoxin system YwqK family antitoxin [Chlamydiales bacterium]